MGSEEQCDAMVWQSRQFSYTLYILCKPLNSYTMCVYLQVSRLYGRDVHRMLALYNVWCAMCVSLFD